MLRPRLDFPSLNATGDRVVCPICAGDHLRVEHVIHGGHTYLALACTGCDHEWRLLEAGDTSLLFDGS
jgi:hypothetical protein